MPGDDRRRRFNQQLSGRIINTDKAPTPILLRRSLSAYQYGALRGATCYSHPNLYQKVILINWLIDHPISKKNRYFNSELPQRTYDPDKAKFYLKKAGMLNHTFKFFAADTAFAGAVDSALLFQESAAKAGVKIKTERVPNDGYWESIWMKKSLCWSFWYGRPTEDWMLSLVYSEKANWNESSWKHERFNRLLIEARSELDTAKRRDMYWEMQKIIHDEGASLIPAFSNFVYIASSKLRYNTIASNAMYDGRRIHERWWFA